MARERGNEGGKSTGKGQFRGGMGFYMADSCGRNRTAFEGEKGEKGEKGKHEAKAGSAIHSSPPPLRSVTPSFSSLSFMVLLLDPLALALHRGVE